ncbi:MAG: sigma-70 family RNA polymerase sigma factor [Alphaproteobacteria bacterium]
MSDPSPPLASLLEATAQGDRSAFAELYAETASRLLGIALRIVGQRDRAEEVLQEAFLRIWKHAGDYAPDRGSPMGWMASIVRNRAIDWRRRGNPETSIDGMPERRSWADQDPSPLDWATASAEARRLRACLDELDTGPRNCVVMAYVEGYTHEELAALLDCPLGTVKSWIRRSLGRLKECLER